MSPNQKMKLLRLVTNIIKLQFTFWLRCMARQDHDGGAKRRCQGLGKEGKSVFGSLGPGEWN